MPISIMIMPKILSGETFSLRKTIEPAVVKIKTIVAKMGYARDKSLKVNTLNQIIKERP